MTLTPADLDLPGTFSAYRPGQFEMSADLAASDLRFPCCAAPPGNGKSLMYMSAARMMGAERTLVLVGTKNLQAQLISDFREAGMVEMMGQGNYRCVAVERHLRGLGTPGTTCDKGPCHVGVYCSLKKDGGCDYFDAQVTAKEASIVVTNYAYWMSLGRYSDPKSLGDFDLLILDEAHTAPEWLANFCTISLDRAEIKDLLKLDLPPVDEGVGVWATWANRAAKIATVQAEGYRRTLELSGPSEDRLRLVKTLHRLNDLSRSLTQLALAGTWKQSEGSRKDVRLPGLHTDWVVEPFNYRKRTVGKSDGIRFSPVWAHAYAESVMFRGIPKIMLVSATLSKAVPTYLGIVPEETDFKEINTSFDASRRPLIYVPTVRVGYDMDDSEIAIWVRRIDEIIAGRLDRKGIIHSRSYDRTRQILERSKYAELMMTHDSRNTRDVVEEFKRANAPRVLVSPAVVEGVDFPDAECHYIIIAKLPFPDVRSPIMKARVKSDPKYRNYVTALSLIQAVGRGMRSANDLCENFIIDSHWGWFRNSTSWPRWFKSSWKHSNTVPPALRLDMPVKESKTTRAERVTLPFSEFAPRNG